MNIQNQFYKLLTGCPYCQPAKLCVLEKYRKMSLLELIDTFNLMNHDQISVLVNEHEKCSKYRIGQKVAS